MKGFPLLQNPQHSGTGRGVELSPLLRGPGLGQRVRGAGHGHTEDSTGEPGPPSLRTKNIQTAIRSLGFQIWYLNLMQTVTLPSPLYSGAGVCPQDMGCTPGAGVCPQDKRTHRKWSVSSGWGCPEMGRILMRWAAPLWWCASWEVGSILRKEGVPEDWAPAGGCTTAFPPLDGGQEQCSLRKWGPPCSFFHSLPTCGTLARKISMLPSGLDTVMGSGADQNHVIYC